MKTYIERMKELENTIQSQQKKIKEDEKEKLDLSAEISSLEEEREELEKEIIKFKEKEKDYMTQIDTQAENISQLTEKVAEEEKEKEKIKKQLEDTSTRLNNTRKILEKAPKYDILLILQTAGPRYISELSKSLGRPTVLVKRQVMELENEGFVKIEGPDEKLKISLTEFL